MSSRRRALIAAGAVAGVLLGVFAAPAAWIRAESRGRIYSPGAVPPHEVAVVLGAQALPDGTPSPFLAARLDTALELLAQGKVRRLLITGNAAPGRAETGAMLGYLLARGVPPSLIEVDGASADTHASCVHARAAGLSSAIVVSQTFHLPRAIALCRAAGVDAVGAGDDTVRRWAVEWYRGEIREWFAGVKAAADILRDRSG